MKRGSSSVYSRSMWRSIFFSPPMKFETNTLPIKVRMVAPTAHLSLPDQSDIGFEAHQGEWTLRACKGACNAAISAVASFLRLQASR